MLDDIDQSFETILSSPAPGATELTTEELADAQRLFREIAANYLTPVRALMIELSLGEPSKEWLAVCRPALQSLRRAAQDMLLQDLADALGALGAAMEQAERSNTHVLDSRTRESLRNAYQPLVQRLPEAFAVDDDRDRREPVIIQSLLRQVPDVRKVTLDRIVQAGIVTLDMFYKAKPIDIAEAAGISRDVAERIVARFQRYRRELGAVSPEAAPQRELTTLENLIRKLEEQTNAFEAAQKSIRHGEDVKRLRQERAATVLELNLLLARMGEVELVKRLERLSFRNKAEELRRFLSARKN